MTKEELLELWNSLRTEEDLPVREGQMVHSIHQVEDEWEVETITDRFRSANVVLAVGRRGAPRKLGVPGEELEKVNYRLLEPEPFANKRVLVVGGGNAAAECAISLAEAGICSKVELSYRRKTFARLRKQVLERFVQLVESGHICVHVLTQVERIAPDAVILRTHDGEVVTLPNDAVIVQVGGTPPSDLLDKFGIQTVEKRAEA